MAFDVKSALDAGYSSAEIAEYLAGQNNFDFQAAVNSGYSPDEIISHLSGSNTTDQSMSLAEAGKNALSNLPGSTLNLLGETASALASPVETAKGLGSVASGAGSTLMRPVVENAPTSTQKALAAWGYALGLRPNAEKLAADEQAFNALVDNYAEAYGDWDKAKNTLANDPARLLSDAAMFLAPASAATKAPGAAGKVARGAAATARAIDPLAVPAMAAGRAAQGTARFATGGMPIGEKLYSSALKPSTTLSPAERMQIIRTGMDEGLIPTQKGYNKAQGLVENLSSSVDELVNARTALEESGQVARNIDANLIAQEVSPQALRVHGNTVSPTAGVNAIDKVIEDFIGAYGDEPLTTSRAHQVKKNTYKAQTDASYGELTGPQKEAQKALARGLKEAVEKNVPGVGELNQRIANIMNVMPQLERSAGRISNNNVFSLPTLATLAGGSGLGGIIGGPVGGMIGGIALPTLMQTLGQPGVKARIGMGLDRAGRAARVATQRTPNLTRPGYAARSILEALAEEEEQARR